jgi:hypothetical protein
MKGLEDSCQAIWNISFDATIFVNMNFRHVNSLMDETDGRNALFAWLISHQPTILFSQNKPATSNQPAVLFSQNKPAPAISHQPTEQAVSS